MGGADNHSTMAFLCELFRAFTQLHVAQVALRKGNSAGALCSNQPGPPSALSYLLQEGGRLLWPGVGRVIPPNFGASRISLLHKKVVSSTPSNFTCPLDRSLTTAPPRKPEYRVLKMIYCDFPCVLISSICLFILIKSLRKI